MVHNGPMEQLNDLAVFVAVAETSGFSAAARRLGVTTSGISKSVGRLEERLGVRLFTRTTRRVALTEEGARFYDRARRILADIADAEEDIKASAGTLRGRIRIDMPVLFGQKFVLPLLLRFRSQYPAIDLGMRFHDEVRNLVAAGVDLAIRMGDLADSDLYARTIGRTQFITMASPAYLDAHGAPRTIDDLDEHICAAYYMKSSGRLFRWRFRDKGKLRYYDPPLRLAVNDGHAYHMVARSGLALVQDLAFHFAADLQSGELVQVLKRHVAPGLPISIIYPEGRHLPKRVRALLDYLIAGLKHAWSK